MIDPVIFTSHSIPKNFFVDWYKTKGREFPWRTKGTTPYQFLLTEILLKQTRAEAVAKIWWEFTRKYDEPGKLLQVEVTEIENDLHILGLSMQRALQFTHMADYLLTNYDGAVPDEVDELLKVPGVGLYSANAILSFAYRKRAAIVDTNILRFFSRYFGIQYKFPDVRRNKWAWEIAENLLPAEPEQVGWHNYGLLDFTGLVCTSRNPRHDICQLASLCSYNALRLAEKNQ